MDMAWIQVFVLSISECVAPAGKTVCQQSQFELEFLTRADCETALEQLVTLKSNADNVIVDAEASKCTSTARQQTTFASLAEIESAFGSQPGWRLPDANEAEPDMSVASHEERLEKLESCDDTGGVAPCKIGSIIVEGATSEPVEVWRRDN